MGTTLTAIQAGGCQVDYVVQIEGYNALLCTSDPIAALENWQGSTVAGCNDITRAFGGLEVTFDQQTAAHPWEPFGQPPICRLRIVADFDATDAMTDDFAVEAHKRSGGNETSLTASVTPIATSLAVRAAGAFTSTGHVYVGPEAIEYGSKTSTSFGTLTRGKFSPFQVDGGDRFARSHVVRDVTTATGEPIGVGLPPLVSAAPRSWIGRWVGVWISRRTAIGGTGLDAPDEAHLAFAGTIAGIREGENGEVQIDLEHALRRIYETRVMSDPWAATLAEGFYLGLVGSGGSGDNQFTCTTYRDSATLTANPLTVVSGAPAGVDEIQAGTYTAAEIAQAINAWLQAEYAAGRIHYATTYADAVPTPGGTRGRLSFADATAGVVTRTVTLTTPFDSTHRFLGWDDRSLVAGGFGVVTGSKDTAGPPLRALASTLGGRISYANPRGTWIEQTDLLPSPLLDASGLADGIVKIGDIGHAVVDYFTGFIQPLPTTAALNRYLPSATLTPFFEIAITLDDDRDLTISQVLVVESDFASLLLKLLLSTGGAAHNHATYDTLPIELGCAIPYSLFSDSFLDDVAGVACADATIALVVDKPTRFVDLFNVDFILRFCFLTWGNGRIHLKSWGTPTAGAATVALTEANKAIATEQADNDLQRSAAEERFEFIRNSVVVKYGRNADGDLVSSLPIIDRDSMAMHGDRAITLEASNTLGQSAIGDLEGLLAKFSATLPMFSRPHKIITRTMQPALYESLTVGTYVTITDSHIRNPETGLRGITGWPGIVVANRHDWGGSTIGFNGQAPRPRSLFGEVSVMIFDRISEAPYCPAAQVDHTATNAGYDAGTKTLKCKSHEYSTASQAIDASRFFANDEVRILEIDPPDPTTALTWLRTVASISTDDVVLTDTLYTPAWDATKKYRIVSADYGSAASSQLTNAYQADDADGLVVDTRQPYGMMSSGTGQATTFALSAATELPARYSTQQVGDGAPFDVGAARDCARLANNLVVYKSAPQHPAIYAETRSASLSGTRVLLEIVPVFLGIGQLSASQTLNLYVAPQIRSKSGAAVSLRVSLCRVMPAGSSLQDVTLVDPYVSATFSTSSTTFSVPTAQALACGHCSLAPGPLGGVAWLVVESEASDTEYVGMPVLYVGPLTTAGQGASGLAMRPATIHWQRDALNTYTPSAQFYARLVGVANHATAYRHRCVYSKSWKLGNASYGYSGTTTIGRFRFRTGHGVTAIRILAIMGKTATGGTGTDPRATLTLDGGGGSVTFYHGLSPTAATDAPDELRIVGDTIAVTADTAYTGYLDAIDYARVLAICVYELGSESIAESTEWFNATIPQARAPIFDAFHGRLLQGLSEIHRHNAGTVAHWSLINGASRTRSSATLINLVDNSTTGAPSGATPGVKLDLTYRATEGVATVPVEVGVYGSMASGSGTVELRDSSNTVKATVTVNSATPGWFTATATLAASLEKYDLYFAGDGANTLSVSAVSLLEWEA